MLGVLGRERFIAGNSRLTQTLRNLEIAGEESHFQEIWKFRKSKGVVSETPGDCSPEVARVCLVTSATCSTRGESQADPGSQGKLPLPTAMAPHSCHGKEWLFLPHAFQILLKRLSLSECTLKGPWEPWY